MKNCCGPFKRGKPAKATNPNQQCFVDCCGNLCPPDNCCDHVKIYYECGYTYPPNCQCDCQFDGYNFRGLTFKKKRKKGSPAIPTFSKQVLEANGFTFVAATVPVPSSSSSSSSSSCQPCSPALVDLTTTGCCLYLSPGGVEAVGDGKVTATANIPEIYGCQLTLLMNGMPTNQIEVQDGDVIDVEFQSIGDCKCCETKRDCIFPQSSMWIQKSNKDKKIVVLNKKELANKVKFAVDRVRKRSDKIT